MAAGKRHAITVDGQLGRWRGQAHAETAGAREGAMWHVTAKWADALRHGGRLDTHQDTPPDAFRV
ncbi:MAG: hypothetical protein Q7T93_03120 [Methylobacterium sp.]|uniref:hypothetical protein n=1 Tax=Methylobacterium sp. TaxID=409 RepID=UPI002723D5C5|nr:hypothetical protein [Methylobacterium sp.]MDO9425802.1 hypothetical protein [Methylobacterium sp.]